MHKILTTRTLAGANMPRQITKLLAIAACFGLAATAHAQTNAQASGNWGNEGTWSNGIPITGVQTNINGGYSVTIDSGERESGIFQIGNGSGQTGTLTVSGDSTTLSTSNGRSIVGDGGGTGTLNVTDGATVTVTGNLGVAANGTSTGTLNVSGGSSLTVTGQFQIERAGDTTVNISGASYVQGNQVYLGNGTKLNLIGSGSTLKALGNISLNIASTGSFIHFALDAGGASLVTANGGQGIDLFESVVSFSTLEGFNAINLTEILLFEATNAGGNAFIKNFNEELVDWGDLDQNLWKLVMSEDNKRLSLVYQIPEPGTTALLLGAAVLLGVGIVRRRKKV